MSLETITGVIALLVSAFSLLWVGRGLPLGGLGVALSLRSHRVAKQAGGRGVATASMIGLVLNLVALTISYLWLTDRIPVPI